MREKIKKYLLCTTLLLLLSAAGCLIYHTALSESDGVSRYSKALELYKAGDYEKAYKEFGKVPLHSSLKSPALFRQARCAVNTDNKETAVKKYRRIVRTGSKSSIAPISEYSMACLMFEVNDRRAKRYFKHIIKKYPSSDYAIASEYYLGMLESEKANSARSRNAKFKERAFIHFKTYIEKSPAGRYALDAIDEIHKLGVKLKNYDNLMIAKAYYANGEYAKAKYFLDRTTLAESWLDFAKNEYKLGNKDKGNYYTELGLTKYASNTSPEDVYEVIDAYIAAAASRKDGISKLMKSDISSTGADYISYLNCSEAAGGDAREACYRTLYEKYPDGQFSADSLFNVFIAKYLQKKYYDAQRLGYLHLQKFPNVKSSPAVIYYMGKISHKLKYYEDANKYYKQVLDRYPDSYYAYRASCNLYKDNGLLPFEALNEKPAVFPYKKSLDNNLVVKLAYLKDYDLVEELCKKDKFIQSWIAYEKKDYTVSAVLARQGMEELNKKPDFNDLRWRLVYPAHYYDIAERVKGSANPVILEAIIKEESHFNSSAKSPAGASGLMQLMPSTYSEISKEHRLPSDIYSETVNITAGSFYYDGLKRALGGRDLYAIAAYNGGIGSVKKWFSSIRFNDTDEFVEQIPYSETKNYVKKVLRTYWAYGNIY